MLDGGNGPGAPEHEQGARTENLVAAVERMVARTETMVARRSELVAPTEIGIVRQKPFAVTSGKDDASAEHIA